MESFWGSGIAFIVWFQSLGGWLEGPMKFFSFLGSEPFFLIFLPLVYWCIDANFGLRIGTILLFSSSLNDTLKLAFHGPRPYWISTEVKAYAAEATFGVPSGHAQIATGLWGMSAAVINRAWAWLLAVLLILLIGLSRLYLAVHFPVDVLAGWAVGALILWAFLHWWDPVAAWVKNKPLSLQVGLAFAASMIMLFFSTIAFTALRGWVIPTEWLENARRAGTGELPAPVTLEPSINSAALLFGMLTGAAWMNARGGFNTGGTLTQKAVRLLSGLIGLLIIYLGLRALFPQGDTFLSYFFRYLRYALTSLWVIAGAPWLFYRMNLAQPGNLPELPGKN